MTRKAPTNAAEIGELAAACERLVHTTRALIDHAVTVRCRASQLQPAELEQRLRDIRQLGQRVQAQAEGAMLKVEAAFPGATDTDDPPVVGATPVERRAR